MRQFDDNIRRNYLQRSLLLMQVVFAIALTGIFASSGQAQYSAVHWAVYVLPSGGLPNGAAFGVEAVYALDGYDSYDELWQYDSSAAGIFAKLYRRLSPDWQGITGFYWSDCRRTWLRAGQNTTWSDFYLWAQNTDSVAETGLQFRPGRSDDWYKPPGYLGHLVIDQVAAGVDWTGRPMDYWIDLTKETTVLLPVAVLSDPSDPTCPLREGTRFSITVYAPPVPEPASLAGLVIGLGPIGITVIRRKLRH